VVSRPASQVSALATLDVLAAAGDGLLDGVLGITTDAASTQPKVPSSLIPTPSLNARPTLHSIR
jgi:hypothetical protein